MADIIFNRVEIIGTKEQVNEVLKFIKGDEGAIDFNKIIPLPEALKVESSDKGIDGMIYLVKSFYGNFHSEILDYKASDHYKKMRELMSKDPKHFEESINLGKVYLRNIADYGFPSWFEWIFNNWGTRGNSDYIEQYDNIIEFETDWYAPIPVVDHLAALFPNVEFNYKLMDKSNNEGWIERKYCNGKLVFEQ